jgi:hypothetical protein
VILIYNSIITAFTPVWKKIRVILNIEKTVWVDSDALAEKYNENVRRSAFTQNVEVLLLDPQPSLETGRSSPCIFHVVATCVPRVKT